MRCRGEGRDGAVLLPPASTGCSTRITSQFQYHLLSLSLLPGRGGEGRGGEKGGKEKEKGGMTEVKVDNGREGGVEGDNGR